MEWLDTRPVAERIKTLDTHFHFSCHSGIFCKVATGSNMEVVPREYDGKLPITHIMENGIDFGRFLRWEVHA